MCMLYTQTHTDTRLQFSKLWDKCTGRIASVSKQWGPLFFSCKFTEDRGVTPGRGLTQNVNSFEKKELLFIMQLFTQKDLLSLLSGCVMQFDVWCCFCRSCFPSLGDGRTSSVRNIHIWFACVCSRKIKFTGQPYKDMLHVLGQQGRWDSSCLAEEDRDELWCISLAPICFLLFLDLVPLFFLPLIIFQLVWLPAAHLPPSAWLKFSKIGPWSPFWHQGK